MYEYFYGEQWVFQKFILIGGESLYYFQKRHFCALFAKCCLLFVNITSPFGWCRTFTIFYLHFTEFFYDKRMILCCFCIRKTKWYVICKICFLLSVFILDAQIMNFPKSLERSHNQPEIHTSEWRLIHLYLMHFYALVLDLEKS